MRQSIVFFALFVLAAGPVLAATPYDIAYEDSGILFSGTHAGEEFQGRFEDWQADIAFDRKTPENSKITASFNLDSVKTDNKLYEGTLPKADWFDSKNHPQARFVSTSVTENKDGTYEMTGDLTIKNITRPVTFTFTLTDRRDGVTLAEGHAFIDRLAYNIGAGSDPKGDWVSQEIEIRIYLEARPGSHSLTQPSP